MINNDDYCVSHDASLWKDERSSLEDERNGLFHKLLKKNLSLLGGFRVEDFFLWLQGLFSS